MIEKRHKGRFLLTLFVLFIGIALGIVGIIKGRDVIAPYIPSFKSVDTNPVQGIVISKLDQGAKLLITVDTPEGALLATFTRKVDEINLLVSEGDVLEFSLLKYEPFITDPAIHRVRKDGALSTLPQEMEVKEEPKGQEMKKSEDTKKPSLQKTKPERTHKPAPKPDKQQDEGIQKPPPAPLPQEQKEDPAVKQNVL